MHSHQLVQTTIAWYRSRVWSSHVVSSRVQNMYSAEKSCRTEQFAKRALMSTGGLPTVLFITDVFTVGPTKITEGGTFWHCRPSQFWYRNWRVLRPLVDPWNTRLLVSQARLDGPRTHFCFRLCCRGNGFWNHFLQPDKQAYKTTHFTIPTWFSFFRVNNHFSFRKARNRKNKSVQLFLVWDTMVQARCSKS